MDGHREDPRDWVARHRLFGLALRGSGLSAPEDVVGRLTAMQAQDHGYGRWSVAQRQAGPPQAAPVDAAFDRGSILRTHLLRPTWHYVTPGDLSWLVRLSGPRVDAANARWYRQLGFEDRTLARSNDVIGDAVAGGPRTRKELAAVLERRGVSSGPERLSPLLMHAELTSVICSGPRRGNEHTYAAFEQRVGPDRGPDGEEALAELAWRYFSTRGPATVADFSWWAGLGAGDARRALAMVQARLSSRESDDRTYWLVDHGPLAAVDEGVDLVQCYDEVIISYRQSRDVLQTAEAGFAVPGDIDGFRHVVLLGGRLLGHWRARPERASVRIETRIAGEPDGQAPLALAGAVERYRHFEERRSGPR
ncbi:MAG: AlkZ family DNA glycosylase [Acidimicrobiales bacterium]|nr:AlkZ family DNA glycosylase [Acidimicrobiales bacterium]